MKKTVFRILILGIIVFVIYNLINFFTSGEVSVIAELETMEKCYKVEGIIIRDEELITYKSDNVGILDVAVSENEMVQRGKHVATYFDSDIDDQTKQKLAKINESISELSRTTDETIVVQMSEKEIDEEIREKIYEISYESTERNPSAVSLLKSDINSLLEKKNNTDDDEEMTVAEKLEQLNAQKMEIEKNYSGTKYEIAAPRHGVFSTGIDGYEENITPELALKITVADYENAKNKDITVNDLKKNGALCKIVDNSVWYVSVIADEATAKSFSVDEDVVIRFDGETMEAKGKVEYISGEQSGKYMITISSTSYCNYAMESRFATMTIVKESNTGLKIPLEAVNVKDGVSGVYVKTENTVKYKEIEILSKDDTYAIVKFDNTKSNSLLLYDEVIVKGK